MGGNACTNISRRLLRFRNRCIIKVKIGCCFSSPAVSCCLVRCADLLALGSVIAGRYRYLHRLLFDLEKTMNNQKTKCLPNLRFEADAQKQRAAQAIR
jgi:hypothetical protein